MASGVTMEAVVSSRIPQIVALAQAGTQRETQQAANNIVAEAKARSRVNTGAMQAGWQSRRAEGDNSYEVFNPVYYTVFNEFGTVNMPAQPMLAPAVEQERQEFPHRLQEMWVQLAMGPGLLSPGGRFTEAAGARNPGGLFGG